MTDLQQENDASTDAKPPQVPADAVPFEWFTTDTIARHVAYYTKHLHMLPGHYTSIDVNRMSVAYFCLSALDLLGMLDTVVTADQKKNWIEWIYAQQIHPTGDEDMVRAGFRGGSFGGAEFRTDDQSTPVNEYDAGHVTMTYTALVCLLLLGDDLARVNRSAILNGLRLLQTPSGSFIPYATSTESDMRFLYSALVTLHILSAPPNTVINTSSAREFIHASQSFQGGFGQNPGQEAHGGSTYCAIASLAILGELEWERREECVVWLLGRQGDEGGFGGRPAKPADTCYSFWVGGALDILDAYKFTSPASLSHFLSTTATKHGGFGKGPGDYPDVLHSYMGLSGVALTRSVDRIRKLVPVVGVSETLWGRRREVVKMRGWS
ncbi:protein geranylgeranyltransferase-like protein type I beta subunit [Phlyctochytrium arcticum]|nr:protein geranylgeranyltransferase-like protein type I beta subunit [Phlyctochytrium arcticum]